MNEKKDINDIRKLVNECIDEGKVEFLTNLIYTFQKNYIEVAELCTEGEYNISWSHKKLLDYITYETN